MSDLRKLKSAMKKLIAADRVLFISPLDLFKRTGGGLANLSYYNAVCSLFPGRVDLLLPQEAIPDGSGRPDWIGVKPRSPFVGACELLIGRLHRFRAFVKRFLQNSANHYDLCFINGGVYAGDMVNLIRAKGIKVVVIHHNCEREYHVDNRSLIAFKGYFPYYVVRNERRAWQQADLNLFLTSQDIATFTESYGRCKGKVALLGCFEPEESLLPEVGEIIAEPVMVISGSMDAYQTVDGICDFYHNYLAPAKGIEPGLKVIITGRNPAGEILKIRDTDPETITVIPDPVDINEIVGQAAIYCCPTYIGGGLKLRVMDGLRLGIPILVHAVSARGYDVFFTKPYFRIYDDLASFKNGFRDLVDLIRHGQVRRREIQLDYEILFGFKSGQERLRNALKTVGCLFDQK